MHLNILEKVIMTDNALDSYLDMVLQFDNLYLPEKDLVPFVEVFYNEKNFNTTSALVQAFWEYVGPCDDTAIEEARREGYLEEDIVAGATAITIGRKCEAAEKNLKILEKEITSRKKEWKKNERVASGIEWKSTKEALEKLYQGLIKKKFLDKETNLSDFEKAFNNGIPKRINWTGNLQALAFLLVRLKRTEVIERVGLTESKKYEHKRDASTFLVNNSSFSSETLRSAKDRYVSKESSEIDLIIRLSVT